MMHKVSTLNATARLLDDCRDDFIMLNPASGSAPVYLDSAATSLRPQSVVEAMRWYLEQGTAAVHRGVHKQSVNATEQYESTRELLAEWLGADADEIIFTSGATAAVNLVRRGLQGLQRVATTVMEHHSNLVPWMDLDECTLIPVDENGQLDRDALLRAFDRGVDLLSITHLSNVLGCITQIPELIQLAHDHGAKVLVDAAQSASHIPIDVKEWDVDFLVCSSHKMLGPSGVGALYASAAMHEDLQPVTLGGQMVDQVSLTGWTPQPPPYCYEAGSPAVESVLGWGAALRYLDQFERTAIGQRLEDLTTSLIARLTQIPGVRILGPPARQRGSLVAFLVDGLESHAIAKILSRRDNIMVRSGFHCAQPLHQHLQITPTVRASLHIYNNEDDLERFAGTLQEIVKLRSN